MQSLSHSSRSRRNSLSSLHCSWSCPCSYNRYVHRSLGFAWFISPQPSTAERYYTVGTHCRLESTSRRCLTLEPYGTLRGWVFQGSRTNEVLTDLRAIHDVTTDRKVAWVSTGKTTAQPVDAKVKAKHALVRR